MTVHVLGVEGRMLHVLGAFGEMRIPSRAGVDPRPDSSVDLRLGLGPCGEYLALAAAPVAGVAWRFGKASRSEGELRLRAGDRDFPLRLVPSSRLDLEEGDWVGARVYLDQGRWTVLEAHRLPGEPTQVGVVADEDDRGFTVSGLDGARCWRGDAGALSIGDAVEVVGSWNPADGFQPRAYTARRWPVELRGVVTARESVQLTVADADRVLGPVQIEPPRPCDAACEAVGVGDDVVISWRLEGGRPVADSLRVEDAPVLAGKLLRREADTLVIDRLGQERSLRIDDQTVFNRDPTVGDTVELLQRDGRAVVVALP